MQITVILAAVVTQVNLTKVCVKLGYDYHKNDPLAKYTLQKGYISCVLKDNNCIDGKCDGSISYHVVKGE